MADLEESDISSSSDSGVLLKIKKVFKKASSALAIAIVGLTLATAGIAAETAHQIYDNYEAGDGTQAVISIDKVEFGESYVTGLIIPAKYSYTECGIKNSGKATTVYYKLTDETTKKSHIREVVFDGISVNKIDDLYSRMYDLSEEDYIKASNAISIKNIYSEVSELNTVIPERQKELSEIEEKLKNIFKADSVYQLPGSKEKDGKVYKALTFCIVSGEGEKATVEKIAFGQNGTSEEVTTNALVDNILIRLDGGFPTGKFKFAAETDARTLEVDQLIAEANSAPAQSETGTETGSQTGTEGGAQTGDPNAVLGA